MLFNSIPFIFVFLPATLALFCIARRVSSVAAVASLLIASLVFYAYWKVGFLALLILSIAFNYGAGLAISRLAGTGSRRAVLSGAIAIDLTILGVFKYSNFFLGSITTLFHLTPTS